jgi:hypothetical protein
MGWPKEGQMKIAGWVLSGLIGLFLALASAAPKFMGIAAATEAMEVVGWPLKYLVLIGVIELGCAILFAAGGGADDGPAGRIAGGQSAGR